MDNNQDAEKNALNKLDQELSKNQTSSVEDSVNKLSDIEEATVVTGKDSLGKVERFDYAENDVKDTERKFGWHRLDTEDFPSGGRYYSKDMRVAIKAATTTEIQYFSVIDENDPYSVDEAITDLLKICLNVSFGNRIGSWKDIKEEDKVYVILGIKELTFAEGENEISFEVKCNSCKTKNKMVIKNENFQRRDVPEFLRKYYSEEERLFIVKSKSYGEIRVQPPSVGIMKEVASYIKKLSQAGENIKEAMPFLKVLPYMADSWRGLNEDKINNLKIEFLRWKKKSLFFAQLTEKMQVGVKEKMKMTCENRHCAESIEADVQLPTGIKGLFVDEDILDRELE